MTVSWRRRLAAIEGPLVYLIALHTSIVGLMLLALPEWSVRFAGWPGADPYFFPRQAGIFHFVLATAYLVERFVHGGVVVLLLAKATAVVFLLAMWALGVDAWSIPLSAAADAAMGIATLLLARRTPAGPA